MRRAHPLLTDAADSEKAQLAGEWRKHQYSCGSAFAFVQLEDSGLRVEDEIECLSSMTFFKHSWVSDLDWEPWPLMTRRTGATSQSLVRSNNTSPNRTCVGFSFQYSTAVVTLLPLPLFSPLLLSCPLSSSPLRSSSSVLPFTRAAVAISGGRDLRNCRQFRGLLVGSAECGGMRHPPDIP